MPRRADPASVIRAQVVLEEHDVAPDGRFAVVVRRFVECDRYRSHLWRIPLDGAGESSQLTSGQVRDGSPRVAPGGRGVVFRRSAADHCPRRPAGAKETKDKKDDDEAARLLVVTIGRDGRPGRPWPIRTPANRSVGEVAWSPDGRHLAFTLDADPPRFIVGPEPGPDESPVARVVRRIDWRIDESGFLDRWQHVFVVEARRGAKPRQLTSGDWGASGIAWSPDGQSIAFSADPRDNADLDPRTSIWVVDVNAGLAKPPREVLALGGSAANPAWSPDGRWIAAIGVVEAGALDDTSPGLVVGPADGSSRAHAVAPELDRPFGAWLDTDLFGWSAYSRTTPCWLDDHTIVAVVTDRGRAVPWRFTIDPATGRAAGAGERLLDGDVATHSLAVAPGAPLDRQVTTLACVGGRPLELFTMPAKPAMPATAAARRQAVQRTRFGGRWAAGLPWPEMRNHQAPGGGGPIETWVASPAGAGDGPLPTIIDVHGGPLGGWAPAPHLEVVLLCAAGYRVVLPNIRGSAGYGREWIRPQLGDWGGVDAADVHSALDHVLGLGLVDRERLGVIGLSYGGFMVNWLVGTSDRFRAAVSENGVSNQISSWAGSDTGVEYNRSSLLGSPVDRAGVDKLWRQSPLSNVASVRTPLLLLQGGADMRCPPSDSEQYFIALRVLGREVQYVLYPDEYHVYASSGRPDRRIDRMERVIDWFDRHLA